MDAAVHRTAKAARRGGVISQAALAGFVICLLASAFGMLAPRLVPMLGWTENWVADIRFSFLAPPAPERQDIVVVAIDEASLATLPYRSPVDRAFLARVLEKLAAAGVRAVGMDLLFDRRTDADKDEALRQAMRSFPAPLVVAWADPGGGGLTAEQHAFMRRFTAEVDRGYANLLRDNIDGTVRWINVWHSGQERLPGLAAAIAQRLGVTLPEGPLVLDYAMGPTPETPAISSLPAFLVERAPPAFLQQLLGGKVVLIGGDLAEEDRFRTPFASGLGNTRGLLPGVSIHGHALAQLLDGREGKAPDLPGEAALVLLAVLVGMSLAWLDVPPSFRVAAAGAVLALLWIGLFAVYWQWGAMLPVVSPSLGFVAASITTSFYQQRRYLRERTFIRGALSRYVAESVVRQLEREPWRLKLGGERRELSFLFTDVAGFTTLSEETEPTVLVSLLNRYLHGASRIVLDHGGTIDKYIGDAIVAIFGAFEDDDDHPARAVRAAVALDGFAREFAAEQRAGGIGFGRTRVGVNTGSAIIGNIGGEDRFDYTAIGDAVNTAARLEGANKYFGTGILVAASTAERAPDALLRPVGEVVLKGRQSGLAVFQPLSAEDPAAAWREAYLEAYRLLQAESPEASAAFQRLANAHPEDPLLALHSRRLAAGETGVRIVLAEK